MPVTFTLLINKTLEEQNLVTIYQTDNGEEIGTATEEKNKPGVFTMDITLDQPSIRKDTNSDTVGNLANKYLFREYQEARKIWTLLFPVLVKKEKIGLEAMEQHKKAKQKDWIRKQNQGKEKPHMRYSQKMMDLTPEDYLPL